jgi:hypothetical protein
LFAEDGADEADDGGAVREDPPDVGASAELLVEPFLGVVRADLLPVLLGGGGERQQVGAGVDQQLGGGREPAGQLVGDPTCCSQTWVASGCSKMLRTRVATSA